MGKIQKKGTKEKRTSTTEEAGEAEKVGGEKGEDHTYKPAAEMDGKCPSC